MNICKTQKSILEKKYMLDKSKNILFIKVINVYNLPDDFGSKIIIQHLDLLIMLNKYLIFKKHIILILKKPYK